MVAGPDAHELHLLRNSAAIGCDAKGKDDLLRNPRRVCHLASTAGRSRYEKGENSSLVDPETRGCLVSSPASLTAPDVSGLQGVSAGRVPQPAIVRAVAGTAPVHMQGMYLRMARACVKIAEGPRDGAKDEADTPPE